MCSPRRRLAEPQEPRGLRVSFVETGYRRVPPAESTGAPPGIWDGEVPPTSSAVGERESGLASTGPVRPLHLVQSVSHPGFHKPFDLLRRTLREIAFGQARAWLRDSADGVRIEQEVAPESVFGDAPGSWMKARYATLCGYAHSRSGYNNADFWESNGPVYRPHALSLVESECRETLAVAYLLLRLGWPRYFPRQGQSKLLEGPQDGWARFDPLLRGWLLVDRKVAQRPLTVISANRASPVNTWQVASRYVVSSSSREMLGCFGTAPRWPSLLRSRRFMPPPGKCPTLIQPEPGQNDHRHSWPGSR